MLNFFKIKFKAVLDASIGIWWSQFFINNVLTLTLILIKKSFASSKCIDGTIWSASPCISNVSVLF